MPGPGQKTLWRLPTGTRAPSLRDEGCRAAGCVRGHRAARGCRRPPVRDAAGLTSGGCGRPRSRRTRRFVAVPAFGTAAARAGRCRRWSLALRCAGHDRGPSRRPFDGRFRGRRRSRFERTISRWTAGRQSDLQRPLVLPQPLVYRMSQHAVPCPPAERCLHDEDRLDPAALLGRLRRGQLDERRRFRRQRRQALGEAIQLGVGESGTDLSREDERRDPRTAALFRVVAEQQRAEMSARPARCGPATDHELFRPGELQLLPRQAAASGGVAPVGPLGDDALPVVLPAPSRQLLAVAGRAVDQPHHLRGVGSQQAFQPPPALGEGKRSQVLVAVAQQVEGHQRGWHAADRGRTARPLACNRSCRC